MAGPAARCWASGASGISPAAVPRSTIWRWPRRRHTSSSRRPRGQKVLATGVYGTKLVGIEGNYDDVNRLCTELCAERDWAFVNIDLRPDYAEGSKTLALESPSGSAGSCPTAASCRSPPARCSRKSPPAQEWTELGLIENPARPLPRMNSAQAQGCSPVASAFADGHDVSPGQAGHDRQVERPGRSPGRGHNSRPGGRPTALRRRVGMAVVELARAGGLPSLARPDPMGRRRPGCVCSGRALDAGRDGSRRAWRLRSTDGGTGALAGIGVRLSSTPPGSSFLRAAGGLLRRPRWI